MELLVVGADRELVAALETGKGTVGVIQVFQLSFVGLVNVRTELEDHLMQSDTQHVRVRY
jgi:hypothetical protein